MSLDTLILLFVFGTFFYLFVKYIFKDSFKSVEIEEEPVDKLFEEHISLVTTFKDNFISSVVQYDEIKENIYRHDPILLDLVLHEAEFRGLKRLPKRPEGLI